MQKIKKVLFVSHGFPCFMSDILFHGLKALGYDVTEYPQGTHYYGGGSTFGGQKDIGRDSFLSFCYFNFPRVPLTDEEILNQDYDAVILTSWIPEKPWILENIYKRFKGKIPIAFVDGEDDLFFRYEEFYNDIYFKRELHNPCVSEFANIHPITFGIIDDEGINDKILNNLKRKYLLSFIASGHNLAGLRCQMFRNLMKHPEKARMFYSDVERRKTGMIPYVVYKGILKNSQIGINIEGEGFDTYRFYEIPYHEAVLFTQRPKIHIENNFIENESAVFFDTIGEFNDKLDYYKNKPAELKRIANNGYNHLIKYHTSSCRAKYVISKLEELL